MATKEATSGRPRALIVGAGIAGLATATRLHAAGWEPIVVERAAGRRTGGYFVALSGVGRHAAQRLGSVDLMPDRWPETGRNYDGDRSGRRHRSMSLGEQVGAPRVMLRGDIERAVFQRLPSDVEIRYSSQPTRIVQDGHGVTVTVSNSATGAVTTDHVDLLVGADGLRSSVRDLVFGPPEKFLHPLGYVVAANILDKPLTGLDAHDGISLVEVGRAAFVFGFSDGTQSAFFNYRPKDVDAEFTRPAAESLRAAFGPQPYGQLLGELLDQFEAASDHLFDSTHQVKMSTWHQGRVVLVGDAAWCPTLYSGLGASSALAGSSLLGDMLERYPTDLPLALAEWETTLRPHIDKFQEYCFTMRPFFMADTAEELALRTERMATLADKETRERFFATEEQLEIARWKNMDIVPLTMVGVA